MPAFTAREAMRLAYVSRPYAGGQAVAGGVGAGDQLVPRFERRCGDDRAKDFFLHQFEGVVAVRKDRRRDEIPVRQVAAQPIAASHDLCAALPAAVQVAQDRHQLSLRHDRPDVYLWREAAADTDALRLLGQPVEHLLIHRLLDEQARPGHALLARGAEHGPRRAFDRFLDIGVSENDVRRFAAQL
jgi:hypothetical protein